MIYSQEITLSCSEAMLLLVGNKNRDLWPGPTPEVHDSQTSCHSSHAHKIGSGHGSQVLVPAKRSVVSGYENEVIIALNMAKISVVDLLDG